MDIGMLWFDANQASTVTDRVAAAASYYKEKYGRVATLCFVHPRPMDTVLPNHFWLGVKPEPNTDGAGPVEL